MEYKFTLWIEFLVYNYLFIHFTFHWLRETLGNMIFVFSDPDLCHLRKMPVNLLTVSYYIFFTDSVGLELLAAIWIMFSEPKQINGA